jgi:hypothetical protein
MRKILISGTRNGANTAFTLEQAPITGGLVLIIHQGLILQRVTGTPTALEYTLTGESLTVGSAPAAGDMFFGYVQVSATQSYLQTAFTGLQIYSNTTFHLATAPPGGSNILLIKNGFVLEEASGTLSATQFAISGTVVTLGVPLLVTDMVKAYIADVASAVLSVVSLTGSRNGLNTRYILGYTAPINYEPDILVVLDGMTQTRVVQNPLMGQFAFVDTKVIRLGSAPNAGVKLQVLLFGITQLSTNPYAFTCERLAQRIGIWVQRRAETVEIEEAVRQIYDEYAQMYQWTFLQIDGMFATEPPKTEGGVVVTLGSRVVQGIGTHFTLTDKGKRFRVSRHNPSYEITNVDVARQQLEIHPPYIG